VTGVTRKRLGRLPSPGCALVACQIGDFRDLR
jgi:hypothetical protein